MEGLDNSQLDKTTILSPSNLSLATLGHKSDKPLAAQQSLAEFIASIKDIICRQASFNQIWPFFQREIYQEQNPENEQKIRIHVYRSIVNQAIETILNKIPAKETMPISELETILRTIRNEFIVRIGFSPTKQPEIKTPPDKADKKTPSE